MTKDSEHVIEVENLTKRYGKLLAVNDISFAVRKGEVFAFWAQTAPARPLPSRSSRRSARPRRERCAFSGWTSRRRKHDLVLAIGVLPQGFSSFDRITVRETIQYYSRLFWRRHADVDGADGLVDLRDKAKEQFQNLSGGPETTPWNRRGARE